MILLEIAIFGCITFFCTSMVIVLFQDTDTFAAIDEKIAEIIRGKEE